MTKEKYALLDTDFISKTHLIKMMVKTAFYYKSGHLCDDYRADRSSVYDQIAGEF